ncbi:MAG: hypothetical protein IKU53_04485 [Firmicutes bacterium]|nr:hypothetical protein [Bacillota bacterium]
MAKILKFSNKLICVTFILAITLGFATIVRGTKDLVLLFFATLAGIDFCQSSVSFLSKRVAVLLVYCFASYGYFFDLFWKKTPLHFIGIVFLGIGIGGIFYVTSKELSWQFCAAANHKHRKIVLYILATIPFLCWLFNLYTAWSNIICNLLLMFVGLILCLVLPKEHKEAIIPNIEHKTHTKNRRKISVFFFMIASSCSLTWTIINQNSFIFQYSQLNIMLLAGIILGPSIILALVSKKGIYSGCVLLIFMSEISLMCISLYSHMAYGPLLGFIGFGLLITSTLTLCPILTYYMLGPTDFSNNYARVIKSLFMGFAPSFLLSKCPLYIINSPEFIFAVIFLLLGSFFAVFSAWNNRLVLLK